jgi:hypothetical protein
MSGGKKNKSIGVNEKNNVIVPIAVTQLLFGFREATTDPAKYCFYLD